MSTTTDVGRPTDYNSDIVDKILDELTTTDRGLKAICTDAGMPGVSTVWRWLAKFPEFWDKYTRARDFQTELMYDDMEAILSAPLTHNGKTVEEGGVLLDGGLAMAEVQRRKALVDVMKFKLAKLQPKRFGDNKNVSHDVNVRHSVSTEQYNALLAAAVAAPKALGSGAEDADFEEVK